MTDPNLPRFLSHQTERPIALLPHSKLLAGIDVARQALAEADASMAGMFSPTPPMTMTSPWRCSSPSKPARPWSAAIPWSSNTPAQLAAAAAQPTAAPSHVAGPAAVLVGSVGPIALGHLARFEQNHPVLRLDVQDARPEEARVAEAHRLGRCAFRAHSLRHHHRRRSGRRGPRASRVRRARRRAQGWRHCSPRSRKQLYAKGAKRIVVAGGETSGAVVAALGFSRARALPAGPLGGGFCVAEGPAGPVSLYLKSGKLGAEDILERALDFMTPR